MPLNGESVECTVDRAERAQLVPADLQLLVTVAEHVAADVVAPPAVADVGSAGGEFRLELQRLPRHDGVAGEADRVAVRARAGVTREGERARVAFAVVAAVVAGGIEVMQVVQAPQRVEARLPRQAALLPVNPPEVDAIFLHRVVELVEVDLHELRIGQVELHGLAAFRIDVHGLGDLRIQLFERAHAVPRVDVERGLHAMLVQPVEEALRIREEVLVPRVAGPAGAVLRVDVVNQVPVHIDDGRGERDAFLFETFDELTVFGFGIAVVAAPPVAERIPRYHRRLST